MFVEDTLAGFGIVTRAFHWLMALALFFLFGLGWWMVRLDYYSPYYTSAPDLHRSLGVLVGAALVARFAWKLSNVSPSVSDLTPFERTAAKVTHWSFYALIGFVCISGYLISTSDGRGIDIFGLFSIPSLITGKDVTDIAGRIHRWLAYATMALATVHTFAAFKHHFYDQKQTLRRMWSGPKT